MLTCGYSRYFHEPLSVNAKTSPVMLMALDRDARLETRSDHPEPRLHVSLQQLEIYALLELDEGQVFLCTVQRWENAWDRREFGSDIDLPP